MNQRTLFLRVGGLLLASAVILVGLILALTSSEVHEGHAYETYFTETVQGLEVGAPVKFRGVNLGTVTAIGLVSAVYRATVDDQIMDPTYRDVVVRFKIKPERVGKLPASTLAVANGLRVRLASEGLTGVSYLELDFLPPDQHPFKPVPWTPRDDYIPSVPSTFAQIQDALQQALKRFDAIDFVGTAKNIDGLITDLRHDISAGDVHNTMVSAQAALDSVRAQIEAAKLPALTAEAQKTAGAITTLVQGPQTRDAIAKADAAMAGLPALVAQLQQATMRTNSSLADAQAELLPILEQTRAVVQNLRETTEALRRDPAGTLLGGPPPKGDGK